MGEITGRKVLFFMIGAFGIIICVNMIMAWQAVRTFPGLEVKNTYVASQTFEDDRKAQESLGWSAVAGYGDGVLTVTFTDADGAPAAPAGFSALVGRATNTKDDVTPEFTLNKGVFATPLKLAEGRWYVRVNATSEDGIHFRQRLPLFITASDG